MWNCGGYIYNIEMGVHTIKMDQIASHVQVRTDNISSNKG